MSLLDDAINARRGNGQWLRDSAPPPSREAGTRLSVEAVVYSDDYRASTTFDCSGWFEQASYFEIRDLALCGWGGDEPADKVAVYCRDDDGVTGVFAYLEGPDNHRQVGFECHVDPDQAKAWVANHRPDWHRKLTKDRLL